MNSTSNRNYRDMATELGLIPKEVPKMLEVRFKVIVELANWNIQDNGCVYPFIECLAQKVKSGEKKEPTETEIILLNLYYDDYVNFMLSANFISDIGEPILDFFKILWDFFKLDEIKGIEYRAGPE